MFVTATEFKTNLGKYLEMARKQDIPRTASWPLSFALPDI